MPGAMTVAMLVLLRTAILFGFMGGIGGGTTELGCDGTRDATNSDECTDG